MPREAFVSFKVMDGFASPDGVASALRERAAELNAQGIAVEFTEAGDDSCVVYLLEWRNREWENGVVQEIAEEE